MTGWNTLEHYGTKWNTLEHYGTLEQGERMQETESKIGQVVERETLAPDVIYQNNIYALVDDLKQDKQFLGLSDEEIKKHRSFFPRLTQLIYNNYLGDLLQNKVEYKLNGVKPVYLDIQQLDILFDIYIDLVGKYKWNDRPSILEFSLLTGINRDTIYKWINGDINDKDIIKGDKDKRKHITREYIDTARKWQTVCENALVDGNGEYVKEIFLLKAKHGYKDNNNDITITVNHKPLVSADELPRLIDLKEQ